MFKKKKSTRELIGATTETEEPIQEKAPNKPPKTPKLKSGRNLLHNRTVLGGIAVFLALFLAFGATPIMNAVISDKTSGLRLKTDLSRGEQITETDLIAAEVHAKDFSGSVLANPESIIGKYAATDLQSGDVLTSNKVTDGFPSDDPYLATLPEGKLALSIAMAGEAESVSGKLRAGDIVRLYAYMNNHTDNDSYQAMSLPELQYIEVLAVTNESMRDLDAKKKSNNAEKNTEKSEKVISTLTLAVNSQQAAALSGLNNCSTLHAALVIRGNQTVKQEALEKQDTYFLDGTDPNAVKKVEAAPATPEAQANNKAAPQTSTPAKPTFQAVEPQPATPTVPTTPAPAATTPPSNHS